ncbi:MAG TPA: glycosyltransferase family 39 protein [Gaiella sp.]|nr:glycosyltransferase family 39 protein [Gaiella sp.]
MSAPAHTRSPADDTDAAAGRLLAALDRVLPFLGPALAAVLGLAVLGRRALVVDEASLLSAAQGSFSDVVEHAISNDPARAGYLALLQPLASVDSSEVWLRLPSVIAGVVAAIAAYRLGRRLAGRRAGAAASIVLATSVGVVSLSRTVGPLALALAAMLVSSALFARAVDRGNAFWWAVYALSAVALPLTHPIAVSALAAQLVAAGVAWKELDLRLAVPALGIAVVECGLLLTAAALDRADAPDGAGPLELGDVGAGIGRALGWSPVVAALAVWGVISLHRRSEPERGRWKAALVAGLVVMPILVVLAAGAVLPVYPRTALTVTAGGLALGAGVGLFAIIDSGVRLATGAALAVVAVAALASAAARDQPENWRAAARFVETRAGDKDTVVVLPERARAAFSYYAPELRLSRVGRGEAVFVVVAGDARHSTRSGRGVVSAPRYALLSEEHAGDDLVVQRWVRP